MCLHDPVKVLVVVLRFFFEDEHEDDDEDDFFIEDSPWAQGFERPTCALPGGQLPLNP
jgi:hypothetical protein